MTHEKSDEKEGKRNHAPPVNLLILDEDEKSREALRRVLARENRRIHAAASVSEARDHLERGVVPDLVLLDLMLPGAGGMEFLELLRRRYPAMKTIVISAKDDVDTVVEVMRLGALDFIRKPFDESAVQVAANEALQYRQLEEHLQRLRRQQVFTEQVPFLYSSRQMAAIMETISQSAPTTMPILITGESGVGKEVVAREIHHRSGRSAGPFVKVNCAALPATLLESELFGFEKGAFTGAFKSKSSRFEKAQDGTLFLDEIGELEGGIQAKFLHVLQDGSYTRLGSNKVYQSNARIVVATNRDLEEAVRQKKFRSDLYYRLNVIRIHVPPLRERVVDIPILVRHFLEANNRKFGKSITLTPEIQDQLMRYPWPGNVRELQNALSRFAVLGKLSFGEGHESGKTITRPARGEEAATDGKRTGDREESLGKGLQEGSIARSIEDIPKERSLKEIAKQAMLKAEREAILRVLEETRWNRSKAALILQISYKALLYKIKECGIEKHPNFM